MLGGGSIVLSLHWGKTPWLECRFPKARRGMGVGGDLLEVPYDMYRVGGMPGAPAKSCAISRRRS